MKPALLTALTAGFFLTQPANAIELDQMTDTERAAFGAEVRAYLLDNPEVIMEAVAVLEARQSAQQAQADIALVRANHDALFNDGHSWIGGNPDGDITLVEFLDYRCGYCRRAFEEVHQLIESDGNIRFIIKEFPILGEDSVLSARFAIAVQQTLGNDAYDAAHAALMNYDGALNETTLSRIAEALGFEPEPILAHINSDDVTAVITANHALAQNMDITGTPSFVMGDQMLRGYLPLASMQDIAKDIRSQ